MASKDTRIDNLKKVPLFSACSRKELERVAKSSDEISMNEGAVIVDQGAMGREAFVILSGEVTIKRNGRKIADLGPGEILGELSLLDHGPRTATAICATDCIMLVIDQRRFMSVIETVPTISRKLLAAMASRVRETDRRSFG